MMNYTEELKRFSMIDLDEIDVRDPFMEAAGNYNQGLRCARGDSLDLAILNLKRCVEMYPDMGNAAKLLSLCYTEIEEYAKGYRVLTQYLNQLEEDDEQAFEYLANIKQEAGPMLRVSLREARRTERKQKKNGLTTLDLQNSELMHDFLCIAGGIILGCLVCFCLIFPSVKQKYTNETNQKIMSYGNDLTSREVEITSLNAEIKSLKQQLEEVQSDLDAYTGKHGIIDAYAQLMTAVDAYGNGDYLSAAKALNEIDGSATKNKTFQSAYQSLTERFEKEGLDALFNQGYTAYKKYKYETAIACMKQCLKMKKDYVEAMYWMGLAYLNTGDSKNAKKYLYKVQRDYPETVWASNSRKYMPLKSED